MNFGRSWLWQVAARHLAEQEALVMLDARLYPDSVTTFRQLNLPFLTVANSRTRGAPGQPIHAMLHVPQHVLSLREYA